MVVGVLGAVAVSWAELGVSGWCVVVWCCGCFV